MGTFQSFKTLKRSFSLLDSKTITKVAKKKFHKKSYSSSSVAAKILKTG